MKRRLAVSVLLAALFLLMLAGTGIWLVRAFISAPKPAIVLNDSMTAPPPPQANATPPAKGVRIGGVVRDDQGQPVANVRLSLAWRGVNSAGQPAYRNDRALTDASGAWSFSGITPEGVKQLSISINDKNHVPFGIDSPPAQPLLDGKFVIVLGSGFELSGKVVDQNGNPISGATVTTRRSEFDSNSPTARTSSSGQFVLKHVPGGAAKVMVKAAGFAPDIQQAMAAANATPIQFKLSPGGTLSGRVVDAAGKPIPQVDVRIQQWRSTQMLYWHGATDARGQFNFPDAPSDVLNFSFNKDGYSDAQRDLTVADSSTTVITMSLLPVFSGHVVDADTQAPIANFTVNTGAQWPGWAGPIFSGARNAQPFTNGNYTAKAGGFGGEVLAWRVRIEADGYAPAISRPITEGGPVTLDFALHRAPDVTGQLVDPAGKPVAGVQMTLLLPSMAVNIPQGRLNEEGEQMTTTDQQGNFHFRPQVGPFEIWATSDAGCAQARRSDGGGPPIAMTLQPWASLRVHGIHKPPGATGGLRMDTKQAADPTPRLNYTNWYYSSPVDESGDAIFERLPPDYPDGLAIIGISAEWGESFGSNYILKLKPGETTTLDLTGTAMVTGRALPPASADSWQMGASQISLACLPDGTADQWPVDWLAAAQAISGPCTYWTDVDADGKFHFPSIAPGKYQYMFTAWSGTPRRASGVLVIPPTAAGGTFTVPDIYFSAAPPLKPGDKAPDHLGRTAQGEAMLTSTFAGRFVVWALWDSFTGTHDGDTPAMAKLSDRFGGNSRVALIAANADLPIDADRGAPPRRPPSVSNSGWTNGYLSLADESLLATQSYYNQQGPNVTIIAPDGTIAAVNLPVDQAADKLAQLLAANQPAR